MIVWCLGFCAECAALVARYHKWRAGRLIRKATPIVARARRANETADAWLAKADAIAARSDAPLGFEARP